MATAIGYVRVSTEEQANQGVSLDAQRAKIAAYCRLHGLPSMDGRVPTFCVTVRGLTPDMAAARLAERGLAVWSGNYYAVEVMRRLGLPDGALRVGIVHYNTADEVDRLLTELRDL